jgi:hypothetical protein
MKVLLDSDECDIERQKFMQNDHVLEYYKLEAREVHVLQPWFNCDAFKMFKYSNSGRRGFTECTIRFPYGPDIMWHVAYGGVPYVIYSGDDKRREIESHTTIGQSPFVLVVTPPALWAGTPCEFAFTEIAKVFDILVDVMKVRKLGPRKEEYCVLGSEENEGKGVVSFKKQQDASKVAHILGASVATPALTGRDINADMDAVCRNPFWISDKIYSGQNNKGVMLSVCGVHTPDSKMGYGARGLWGGGLSSRNCPLCSHGNGDHKCTNTGVHTSAELPENYDDFNNIHDILRCSTMTLFTIAKQFGMRCKVEKAVYWLRTSKIKELGAMIVMLKAYVDDGFGDAITVPVVEEETEDSDSDLDSETDHDDSDSDSDDEEEEEEVEEEEEEEEEEVNTRVIYQRKVAAREIKVKELKALISKLDRRIHGYAKATVHEGEGSGIDIKGMGEKVKNLRILFQSIYKKLEASGCCKTTNSAVITAACIKNCFSAVQHILVEIESSIDDVFDYEFEDEKRKTLIILTSDFDLTIRKLFEKFQNAYTKLYTATLTTIRAGQRSGGGETISWAHLFRFIGIEDASNAMIRQNIKRLDAFYILIKTIVEKPTILLTDFVQIIKHKVVKYVLNSKKFAAAVDIVGKGRHLCYMFAPTTLQRGCTLHAENNWQCTIHTTKAMGLADLQRMILPGCTVRQKLLRTIYVNKKSVFTVLLSCTSIILTLQMYIYHPNSTDVGIYLIVMLEKNEIQP